jgi:anaerobic magnesium-protoporphyrin IX monomethyl ester cyclase
MDVLLIKPSARRIYERVSPSLHEHIGLEYIAGSLRAKGVAVGMVDLEVTPLDDPQLGDSIARGRPAVLGISVATSNLQAAAGIVAIARQRLAGALIVVGGPHVSALPEESLAATGADVAVVGEGEHSFVELVEHQLGGGDWTELPGLCFLPPGAPASGGYHRGPPRPLIEPLDPLPFPVRDLVPRDRYGYYVPIPLPRGHKRAVFASMLTSRGCPFSCIFCSSKSTFGSRYRARSVEDVCREIEGLVGDFGVNLIYFNDDTFTLDKARIHALCDQILARRIPISWLAETRVDCVSRELLAHMSAAGCKILTFGIEAGHPATLERIRKGITVEQVRSAFSWARAAKLRVQANFMLGHPGETRREMEATIALAKELEPFIVGFYNLLPLPGTVLHDMASQRGALDTGFYSDLMFFDRPPLTLCELSPDELLAMQQRAYREYYLRPSQVLAKLLSLRSRAELERMLGGLRSVMKLVR